MGPRLVFSHGAEHSRRLRTSVTGASPFPGVGGNPRRNLDQTVSPFPSFSLSLPDLGSRLRSTAKRRSQDHGVAPHRLRHRRGHGVDMLLLLSQPRPRHKQRRDEIPNRQRETPPPPPPRRYGYRCQAGGHPISSAIFFPSPLPTLAIMSYLCGKYFLGYLFPSSFTVFQH
ncbi:hypothetical protein PVAP13_8NG114400 [Panicum virgatum]|uniref:Uncharacterized protein n=1 Tax=Panicum virgatum TaxID=38727 RepID=A0A8T0P7X9_PANVG|nr:hypothetical protein PVAP13_8NG114400 [Panicum virgatum]